MFRFVIFYLCGVIACPRHAHRVFFHHCSMEQFSGLLSFDEKHLVTHGSMECSVKFKSHFDMFWDGNACVCVFFYRSDFDPHSSNRSNEYVCLDRNGFILGHTFQEIPNGICTDFINFLHVLLIRITCCRLVRQLKITCVGVKWIKLAKCSRSGADRYFCCLKRLSNS